METNDGKNGKKYKQVFSENMSVKGKPKITSIKVNENSKKDWTRITFKPDLKRFAGMTHLNADIVALMTKRTYDIAASNPGVKVTLNGEKLKIKNFLDYAKLFVEKEGGPVGLPLLHQKFGDRWEVAISVSDGQFQQNSFVNSIATIRGGTHVNHVADQVVKELVAHVKKKQKTTLKPFQVKNHLWVFVNCLIENPAFDSQTKCTLTSKPSTFGSKCKVDDKFMKKVIKCGVVDNIMAWAKMKQSAEMKRKDGGKGFGILGLDLTMNVNKWLDSDTHVPVGDYTKSCDYKDCCWQPKKNSLRCMCHPPKEDGTPVDGSDKYEAYLNTGKCTEIAFTWQVFNTNDNGKPKLDCKALNLIDDRSQWVPGM